MSSGTNGGRDGNVQDFSTDEGIRRVVDDMHIVPLAMSLVHLTGDGGILDEIAPFVHGPWDYSEKVPPGLKGRLSDRMAEALKSHLRGGAAPAEPPAEMMQRMLSVAVADTVPPEYMPMIRAQMGLDIGTRVAAPSAPAARKDFHVVIVGAGVSGICAAIQLKEAGISFEIIEKNDEVGGTWLENRYPGCAVDTPNHFYQFSFEPNDDWPNYYSRQIAILDYLRHCVDK